MSDKDQKIQDIFKMAEQLGMKRPVIEEKIPTVEVAEAQWSEVKNTLPTQYVGVTGLTISSKNVETGSFISKLEVDNAKYSKLQVSEEQAGRIRKSMGRMTTGATAVVPLKCIGPDCAFKSTCPYQIENVAPIGQPCLVEVQLIHYWMEKYIEEFNVDERSPTDMHMVARLCEYDIYDMRVTKYLAENDQTLLTDFISSYDEEGNPISNKAISSAFEAKERIERMRAKTLKDLMATREAKSKVALTVLGTQENASFSALREKYEKLIRDKGKIIDVTQG